MKRTAESLKAAESPALRVPGPGRLALALLLIPISAACGSLQPSGQGIVARDVLEIKHMLEAQKEERDSNDRKVGYRLDTLDEKVQTRTEMLRSNIADLDRVVQAQTEEANKLRKQVEALNYQVTALTNKLGLQPAPMSEKTQEMVSPTSGPQAALEDAVKQYQLGRYDLARKGFEQLLASGTADLEQATMARYYLGETLYTQNDLQGALAAFLDTADKNKQHNLAWKSAERIGEINQKLGKTAEAVAVYEMILNNNPSYDGIDRVRQQLQSLKPAPVPGGAPAQPPGL